MSASQADLAVATHSRGKPWIIAGAVVLVFVTAGVVVAMAHPLSSPGAPRSGVVDNADATSLAIVTRQDLSSQTQVPATLGYAGDFNVVNQAQGTVTAVPAVGQVVTQGQVLYQVSGAPVVLLYGATPAYRTLSEGVTGTDVTELNTDLVALAYVTGAELPRGTALFTYWTEVGVEKLQKALGVTENGTLALGQAVFAPSSARVTSVSAVLGTSAQPGQPVLSATSTTRQVSIALDAAQQSEVSVGDRATITLPNNRTTPGLVSSVGTVATAPPAGISGSSPTIAVLVDPTDSAATGTWDQAPVSVTITTGSVSNALVVPVNALVALSGGGYAIEVVGTNGVHHLVAVSLGLFDDAEGMVQVNGAEVFSGQRVVVPAS